MAAPKPQILASGGTPLGVLSFGVVPSGSISATISLEVWNSQGDPTASPATELRLDVFAQSSEDSDYNQLGPVSLGFWFQAQITGLASGGTGAPVLQTSTWSGVGAGRPLLLNPIPADSGRTIQVRLNLPAGAPTDTWRFLLKLSWQQAAIPIPLGAWEAGARGVLSGAGDGNASFVFFGGVVTPDGPPDGGVTVSDTAWRFQGLPVAALQQSVVLDQHDGTGTALTSGQGYWATLSCGAGPGYTVTKGTAATAPVPITGRVPPPAPETLLGYVQVTTAAAVGSGDIDQSEMQYGGYLLTELSTLTTQLGAGSAFAGDALVENDSSQPLTIPPSLADVRIYLLPSGQPVVQAPPRPDPQATELWDLVSGSSSVTSAMDVRPWVRPDPQTTRFELAGPLTSGQTLLGVLPGPEARGLALPAPVVVVFDAPLTTPTGTTILELEYWSGSAWVTLFTSSGTQDRRPTASGASLVVSTAALPEVVVLPGGTPVRVRVASVSTPAPAGAYLALTTERLT